MKGVQDKMKTTPAGRRVDSQAQVFKEMIKKVGGLEKRRSRAFTGGLKKEEALT